MSTRHHVERDENADPTDASRTYDPIQASWSQAGNFNLAWLRGGERLTLLQRSGYTLMSLLFVAFGLYLLRFFVLMFRSGDFIFTLIFGGAALLFLMVGILDISRGGERRKTPAPSAARWDGSGRG